METEAEATLFKEWVRSTEPWVWPAIAIVLVSGAILIGTLAGLFWLAAQPARHPIVIWMSPAAEKAIDQKTATAAHTVVAQETHRDVRAD